ncbi:VOC family protein [Micromonospora avicenniae]|uniref:VOC family protein n=1 Tax=Micromonospora avicenniae TaxID=1198245 RepID=UPI00331B7D4D
MTVDCHDPERLAAFWCEVLDFEVIDRSEGKVESRQNFTTMPLMRQHSLQVGRMTR